jgi:hypothetical protein
MANEVLSTVTRGQLVEHIQEFVQDRSENRAAMIRRDLDHAYRIALRRYEWPHLIRWQDSALQYVDGQAFFFAPKDAAQILRLQDQTTPINPFEYSFGSVMDLSGGLATITSVPTSFAHVGTSAINVAIPAGTLVEVVSNDPGDVRQGVARGRKTEQPQTLAFTLLGDIPLQLGSWDEIAQFSLTTSSETETVIVRISGGGQTLTTIAPNEVETVYQKFRLFPLSSGPRVIRVVYRVVPPAIFSDDHVYLIPIQDYLIEYGISKSLQSRREPNLANENLAESDRILMEIWNEVTRGVIDIASPLFSWSTNGRYGPGGIVIRAHGYPQR